MKEIQEIKNDIMLLKNLGNISKEVELVLLRKLTSLEKQLRIGGVSNRFSEPEKMAEWLHNNYEEIALNNGWKTHEDCQVPFLDLPKENKETMIELCDLFINGC